MAMGRQGERLGALMLTWSEMPRSPGHVFYDRLQQVLVDTGFDGFVEDACKAYYARTMGAPSIPPGRYFRMHMVGYFEGIDSERASSGDVPTRCPYASFSGWRPPSGCRTIPGCPRRGAAFPTRCTSRSSPGFWP